MLLSCCIFAACYDDEEKWEPEVAISLAYFELDISRYLQMDTFLLNEIFPVMVPSLQTSSLKRAIRSLDSLDVSVRDDLPIALRSEMDNFLMGKNPMSATKLLETLMEAFRANKHFIAINSFTYEIVTEAGEQDSVLGRLADVLLAYYDNLNVYASVTVDIGDFSDNVEQIQEIKLQSFLNSRLQVDAEVQVSILDPNNEELEQFEAQLQASGQHEKQETPQVYHRDEARKIIRSMDRIAISVFSKSLGLTFADIKHLHEIKINISTGLIAKIAINSNEA
ncbi:MAG: hypothetical protein LBF67_09180 [Prevotellaceae bacterium]|nr:hypothetical protein [Prevotellaceae bacterium]